MVHQSGNPEQSRRRGAAQCPSQHAQIRPCFCCCFIRAKKKKKMSVQKEKLCLRRPQGFLRGGCVARGSFSFIYF